jgi:hypothetical protein
MSAFAAPSDQPSVTALLEALRATGVQILYSSDLVPPDMKVTAPLSGADPMARAKEALAAHGLSLRKIDVNSFAVVAAAPRVTAPTPSNSPATDGPASVSEVSVYASRYALGGVGIGEPNFLSSTDIAEVPGSQNDALRAMRVLPGLATNGSARPYIRGSLLDDVLVQFDGVPLADPFHLKDFQSLLSAFDASAVDRIEVYSGGFPVRYGTRSGGVIDITPRALSSGYEYAVGASLVAYNASAVGHSDGFPMDWLATVRRSNEDALLRPLQGETGEPVFMDSLGRVRWRAGEDAFWTVGWLLLDDRIQLALDNNAESANARYRDEYGWLAYDRDFGEQVHSRTVLAATHTERSRSGNLTIDNVANGHLDEARDTESYELRSDWTWSFSPRLHWSYGLEIAHANADLSYARADLFSAPIAASFSRPVDNGLSVHTEPHSTSYAIYTAARRRWSSIETELGVRLDAQDYEGLKARAQISPRFNVRYDLSPEVRVYGSWGRFSQAQRVDELRVEEAQVTPDEAEFAVHSILGVSWQRSPETRFALELYRKRWSNVSPYFDNMLDRLSLLPDLQPDRVRVAANDSEAAGIEISARRALTPSLEAFGSYTYSDVDDELATQDVPRSWDQPHAATAGLSWNAGPFDVSALFSWHRGWPRTPFVLLSPDELSLGSRNSERWGNYYALDLRAGLTIPLLRNELAAWIELTNSTDRENPCCVRFDSTLTTPDSWQPRILNAGFSLRFRNKP